MDACTTETFKQRCFDWLNKVNSAEEKWLSAEESGQKRLLPQERRDMNQKKLILRCEGHDSLRKGGK